MHGIRINYPHIFSYYIQYSTFKEEKINLLFNIRILLSKNIYKFSYTSNSILWKLIFHRIKIITFFKISIFRLKFELFSNNFYLMLHTKGMAQANTRELIGESDYNWFLFISSSMINFIYDGDIKIIFCSSIFLAKSKIPRFNFAFTIYFFFIFTKIHIIALFLLILSFFRF